MDKELRAIKVLSVSNVDGALCTIETPMNEAAVKDMGEGYQLNQEYLTVVSDDPYCWGRVDARKLYEELKKRYG